MTLTLDEVRNTKFHMARRSGYEVTDVDLFVDRVEASFAQLLEENQGLKAEVDALKSEQAKASSAAADRGSEDRGAAPRGESAAETTATNQPRVEAVADRPTQAGQPSGAGQRDPQGPNQQRPSAPGAATGGASGPGQVGNAEERIVVSTAADASPAVVRLVQWATEQAERLVGEAREEASRSTTDATNTSQRTLAEAKQQAQQITTDARTRAERIESEARVNADKLRGDAQAETETLQRELEGRRSTLFNKLESERDALSESVTKLRQFEQTYRSNLTSHLRSQLQAVESGSLEPDDAPELSSGDQGDAEGEGSSGDSEPQQVGRRGQPQTDTPRLDALLRDRQ